MRWWSLRSIVRRRRRRGGERAGGGVVGVGGVMGGDRVDGIARVGGGGSWFWRRRIDELDAMEWGRKVAQVSLMDVNWCWSMLALSLVDGAFTLRSEEGQEGQEGAGENSPHMSERCTLLFHASLPFFFFPVVMSRDQPRCRYFEYTPLGRPRLGHTHTSRNFSQK